MTKSEELVSALIVALIFIGLWAFCFFQGLINPDPDLTAENKREAVHQFFEREAAGIELPGKTTVSDFQKGGKIRSSILDYVTYRTDLPRQQAASQVDREMQKKGWSFWKTEDASVIYCKGKFDLTVSFSDIPGGSQTDVKFGFNLGLRPLYVLFGELYPEECKQ